MQDGRVTATRACILWPICYCKLSRRHKYLQVLAIQDDHCRIHLNQNLFCYSVYSQTRLCTITRWTLFSLGQHADSQLQLMRARSFGHLGAANTG